MHVDLASWLQNRAGLLLYLSEIETMHTQNQYNLGYMASQLVAHRTIAAKQRTSYKTNTSGLGAKTTIPASPFEL